MLIEQSNHQQQALLSSESCVHFAGADPGFAKGVDRGEHITGVFGWSPQWAKGTKPLNVSQNILLVVFRF